MKRGWIRYIAIVSIITALSIKYDQNNSVYAMNKKTDEVNDELDKVLAEIRAIEAEELRLQSEIDNAYEMIEKIEERKLLLEEESIGLEKEIEELNKEKSEKYTRINNLITIQYEQSRSGYLQLLLESENFNSFLRRIEVIKQLVKSNDSLVEEVKELENNLRSKSDTLKTNLGEIEKQNIEVQVNIDNIQLLIEKRDSERNTLLDYQYALEEEISLIQEELANSALDGEYNGIMSWPVPGYTYISSYYGYRIDPINGTETYHKGLDIPAPKGVQVIAANDGVVVRAEYSTSYGNLVVIDHGGGVLSYYAHNDSLSVTSGQAVKKGQEIAKVGTTGYSTGDHVHFEVQVNGSFIDPLDYLN